MQKDKRNDREMKCRFCNCETKKIHTGINDVNGVEMCEGDIVVSKMYGKGRVVWLEEDAKFSVEAFDSHPRYYALHYGDPKIIETSEDTLF